MRNGLTFHHALLQHNLLLHSELFQWQFSISLTCEWMIIHINRNKRREKVMLPMQYHSLHCKVLHRSINIWLTGIQHSVPYTCSILWLSFDIRMDCFLLLKWEIHLYIKFVLYVNHILLNLYIVLALIWFICLCSVLLVNFSRTFFSVTTSNRGAFINLKTATSILAWNRNW